MEMVNVQALCQPNLSLLAVECSTTLLAWGSWTGCPHWGFGSVLVNF